MTILQSLINLIFPLCQVINIYNFICSGMLSHDAKLRCDLVDLYYSLYGTKVPFCLPIPEIATITKPRKAGPPSPEREVRLICLTLHDRKFFLCTII